MSGLGFVRIGTKVAIVILRKRRTKVSKNLPKPAEIPALPVPALLLRSAHTQLMPVVP